MRALVGAAGATALLLTATPSATAAAAPAASSSSAAPRAGQHRADDPAPLEVSIDAVTPGYLPARGKIEVTGLVTNASEETWTTIKLYAFVGDDLEPMRTERDLARAVRTPADDYVGDRILDAGKTGSVDRLEPGESATYRITVPASTIRATRPGVYWFGVHALGQSDSSLRETNGIAVADGKARTFLPYVPQRLQQDPLPAAFVVPLQRDMLFAADGSLTGLDQWRKALEPGGRLRDTTDLVAAAGTTPITYVLDPALLDAVARLARGNPARDLGASPGTGEVPGTPKPTETSGAEEDPGDPGGAPDDDLVNPDDLPADVAPVARAATDWLDSFRRSLPATQVLALPYGNLDLSAAAAYRPEDGRGAALYELARAQRDTVLQGLDVETSPAVTSPGGYLDAGAVGLADRDATVLLSDHGLQHGSPGVAEVAGRRAAVTESAFSTGGPGPSPAFSGVALRQRLLSEAAIRLLKPTPAPLVVSLPQRWDLAAPDELFTGLDVPWIDFGTVDDVLDSTPAQSVAPSELVYPLAQAELQVQSATFDAVDDLIESGDDLQSILTDNFDVAGVITEQALTALSYNLRRTQFGAQMTTRASTAWVADKLGSVDITAPRAVTLSSSSGTFATTLRNGLDQPVTVTVTGESDDGGIRVTAPADPVTLQPGRRTTVLLTADATSSRVHNVTLRVTDADGHPVGPSEQLPIRSAQVSAVIWLIMGTGAGLLFLAIVVRLVRRMRTSRTGEAAVPDPIVAT